jgi:hypothetical protein
MTSYTPKHLTLWTRPQHYIGAEWHEYYAAKIGRHRDSDSLEESNWFSQLESVGGESDDETVVVVRENHFLVGWVEWLAIHKNAVNALRKADEVAERYEDYPVLDEDDWSQRQVERGEDL